MRLLEQVLAVAFNQRRKTIHYSLGTLFTDCELEEAGLALNLRAENITLAQYCVLADILWAKNERTGADKA